MFYYVWWVPLALVMYTLVAYLSVKNTDPNLSSYNFWYVPAALWVAGALPLWVFVSRFYKETELNFIGILYDIILLVTFQVTLILMGCADRLSISQWIGLGLMCVGVLTFKIF